MNKGFIYGTALALTLATGGIAMGKSQPQTTTGFIKGTYNCQLTGGYIAQPGSTGQAQFTVDGKGNVTATPGELAVAVGGANQPTTASNGFFFLNQYSFQSCNYTPSGGSYTIGANGVGTLSIDWTASTDNADSPIDCTGDITTDYNVLISSPASFTLNSTDLLPNNTCGNPNIDYPSCGSSFEGTCQQQSPKL